MDRTPHDAEGELHEFSVAAGRTLGLSPSRLRAGAWERPFHGVRQHPLTAFEKRRTSGADGWIRYRSDILRRARAFACIMPTDAFFTGPTAAAIWDLPLPPHADARLWVGVPHPRTAPQRPGVRGVQTQPHMVHVVQHHSFPVADPASTWASLGGLLGAYDLTAVADRIVRRARHPGHALRDDPLSTVEQLGAALDAGRRRGAADLRAALHRARDGSSSRPETWVRCLALDGGLPEPMLDHDVYSDEGLLLGCSELAYPEVRLAVEYEGRGHLTPEQLRRDAQKYTDYQAAGWGIVRLTHADVFSPGGGAVRQIDAALRRRGLT
jgi:hypothetical protein